MDRNWFLNSKFMGGNGREHFNFIYIWLNVDVLSATFKQFKNSGTRRKKSQFSVFEGLNYLIVCDLALYIHWAMIFSHHLLINRKIRLLASQSLCIVLMFAHANEIAFEEKKVSKFSHIVPTRWMLLLQLRSFSLKASLDFSSFYVPSQCWLVVWAYLPMYIVSRKYSTYYLHCLFFPPFVTDFDKPDFKRSIVCLEDLQVGTVLTGKVENATLFGIFVDIGVGKSGLIPIRSVTEAKLSKTKKRRSLGLGPGERVEVQVLNIDIPRSRITLDLIRVLWVSH